MSIKKQSLVMSADEFAVLKAHFIDTFARVATVQFDLASEHMALAKDILTVLSKGYYAGSKEGAKRTVPAGRDWYGNSKETGDLVKELWNAVIDPLELNRWSAVTMREPSRHPVRQSVERYVRLLRFDAMKAAGDNPTLWGVTDPRIKPEKSGKKVAEAVSIDTPAARIQTVLSTLIDVELDRFTAQEAVALAETLSAIAARVDTLRTKVRDAVSAKVR